jgi:hypothetical protein
MASLFPLRPILRPEAQRCGQYPPLAPGQSPEWVALSGGPRAAG